MCSALSFYLETLAGVLDTKILSSNVGCWLSSVLHLISNFVVLLVQVYWHGVYGRICDNPLSFFESEACASVLEDSH